MLSVGVFRWFKFTLKPPNSIRHGYLLLAIWDTSHWNFFVKFGLKAALGGQISGLHDGTFFAKVQHT